jgi:hypothetical protein
VRHYDKPYTPILLIANLVLDAFHFLEIKLYHAKERRNVGHLNYLLCAS